MTTERENLLRKSRQGGLSVRDMQGRDLSQILAIENNAQASPWGRLSFEESLSKKYRCRVVEMEAEPKRDYTIVGVARKASAEEGTIVAYHVVSEIVDELHILNVVAAPQYHGLGLGHRLMADMLEFAESRGLLKVFLEVRASNTVAKNLYLKWQFKQIALRKEYYRPSGEYAVKEDALVLMRKL